MAQLPPEWAKVIAGRRSMLHYKPAAIIVVLDMVEAGEVQNGLVPFAAFERRPRRRLRPS